MKQIDIDTVRSRAVASIGLVPHAFEIESSVFVAASLRRIASSRSPCTSSELVSSVCEAVFPLAKCPYTELEDVVKNVLEHLIGNGDFIEEHELETSLEITKRGRVLYLRPPSFVVRENGSVLLIGVPSNNANMLGSDIEERIQYFSHARRLSPLEGEDLPGRLRTIGLTEVSVESWERRNMVPHFEKPDELINRVKSKLMPNPGSVEELEILRPDSNVRYYRSRWERNSNQNGCYVGRRPQAFGNKIWCFVELQNGVPMQMVDLPVLRKDALGRDEAWRLQMAIDASAGHPQEFTINKIDDSYEQIKFFSPVPSWAQRRWDNLAEPSGNDTCLFSYRFLKDDISQEVDFICDKMWMTEGKPINER